MSEDLDGQILNRRDRASKRASRRLRPRFFWGITKSVVPATLIGLVGTELPMFDDIPDEWIWGGVSLGALVGIVLTIMAVLQSYQIQMGMAGRATLRDIDRQYPEN